MTTLALQPSSGNGRLRGGLYGDTNYTTSPAVSIGNEYVASNAPGREIFEFADLSGIPTGATITAAQLEAYEYLAQCDRSSGTTDTSSLHRVLRDWVDAQITFNSYATGSAWTTAGCGGDATDRVAAASSTLALPRDTTAAGWRTWTGLATDVAAFKAGTYSNYGWLLACPTKESIGQVDRRVFYSCNYTTDTSRRPKLTVTYTEGASTTCPIHLLQHRSIGIGLGGPHA